jgi:hypothetical protein
MRSRDHDLATMRSGLNSRLNKVRSQARPAEQAAAALAGLEELFPGRIGEA